MLCTFKTTKRASSSGVRFPDAPEAPAWLQWTSDDWQRYGHTLWKQVDQILNVEAYLQTYFKADERVANAEAQKLLAESTPQVMPPVRGCTDLNSAVASVWCERVQLWRDNLRRDLRDDGVPAPGACAERWLLFAKYVHVDAASGNIICDLCDDCVSSIEGP